MKPIPKRKTVFEQIPKGLKCSRCGLNARDYFTRTKKLFWTIPFLDPVSMEPPDKCDTCPDCAHEIMVYANGEEG